MTETFKDVWLYSNSEASMNAASDVAFDVAKSHGADLTLLSFVETEHLMMQGASGRELLATVQNHREGELRILEQKALVALPAERVRVMNLGGEVAWHALTTHAVKNHPDLLVVPADGGATAGPFGTLSQHLFRKCPSPIWSVQAGTLKPNRVLVAVDSGMKGSDPRILSHEIIRVAKALTKGTAIEVHVADAWSLHDESLFVSKLGVEGTTPYLQIQKQYVEEFTAELIEDSGSRERIAAVHYPKGEPGIVIPALALEIGADVVILGSAARRGLQGFFMGSVAETILSRLTCSALVVKRPGFLSPVKVG